MKILCKIGIHEWKHYIDMVSSKSHLPLLGNNQFVDQIPVKICKKCMIRYESRGYWMPYKYAPGSTHKNRWVISDNYSTEEIREIKLRSIFKGND